MDSRVRDSSGCSNPQTTVGHRSPVKKRWKTIVSICSRIKGKILASSRINSAPAAVGRADVNNEENKNYELQRQSWCGNLLSKHSSQDITDDTVKTHIGCTAEELKSFRMLFSSKHFRARSGNYSLEAGKKIEKRQQSMINDSNLGVSKECPKESADTTQELYRK